MIKSGYEVKENINCWCGLISDFHHISQSTSKDNKKTVWYKCPCGHRSYVEISSKGKSQFKAEKKPKEKKIYKGEIENAEEKKL